MLRRAWIVFASCISLFLIVQSSHSAEMNTSNYDIYIGDVNGDGYSDYYLVQKPLFVLLHGDIATPLLIKGTANFVIYGDVFSSVQSLIIPEDQLITKITLGQLKLAQLNTDVFIWNNGTPGQNNILLRGATASAPAVLLASSANNLSPSIIKTYSPSTYLSISDKNIPLSITDVNGDGKKDILLGNYTSGTSAAQIAYLSDAAGVPIRFFEVTPSSSRPLLAATNVGTTAGQFRVDESGAATYSIPIGLPAGVAGVAPEIALNYSSQAGNGLVGKGWSLSGASGISRCRQTLSQDNGAKAITFSAADRFCLNGQRLILVSGASYGAVGSTYKTEIDSFVTVTANGGSAGHPSYFTVAAKDGSMSTYGGTVDSKIGGSAANTVLTWAISRFEDNVKNGIDYVYEGDATTGARLSVINYAFTSPNTSANPAALVNFYYEDRPDPTSAFVAGYEFKQTKRLNKIKVSNNGTELRTFNLSYMASLSADARFQNNISRLEHVQECKATSCFLPLTFSWGGGSHIAFSGDSSQQVNFADSTAGKTVMNQLFADITGDGKSDLIYLLYDRGRAWVYVKRAGSTTQSSIISFANYNDIKISNFDYNADGRQDLAIYDGAKWKVYLSTVRADGTWAIDSSSVGIDVGLTNKDTAFVDINSDGLADAVTGDSYRLLVRNTNANTSNQAYSFSTNSTTTPKTAGSITWDLTSFPELQVMPTGSGISCTRQGGSTKILLDKIADFNGDGVVDFVGTYSDSIYCTGIPSAPGPQTMNREYKYALVYRDGVMANYGGASINSSDIATADLNGDGLTDLIYIDSNNKYSYRINNGNGFGALVDWITLPVYSEAPLLAKPQFLDFNGDGATDIVWNDRNTAELKVRLWGSNQNTTIHGTSWGATDSHFLMDLNGDGVLDHIQITSTTLTPYIGAMSISGAPIPCHNISIPASPGYACVGGVPNPSVAVPKNEQSNAIVSIANGLGNITKISYGSLANPDADNVYHYTTTDVNAVVTNGTYVTNCNTVGCPPVVSYTSTNASDFYSRLNGGWDLPAGSNTLISGNSSKGAPVLEVNGSMQIVTAVESSAPTAGATPGSVNQTAMSKVSYFYGEAKMQASGRGFLGFNRLKTVDAQSGIATVTNYRQDFPFIGSPLSTIVYAGNSDTARVLSRADNTWSFKTFTGPDNTKSYQPLLTASKEVSYDAWVPQLLQTTVTNNLFDDYGNPTKITQTTTGQKPDSGSDSSTTKETINIYGDEYYQRMGRLTNSTVKTTRDTEPSRTRTSSFTYYADGDVNGAKGLLKTETVEPGNAAGITTEYQYDKFGNKYKTLTTALNSRGVSETRTLTTKYDQSNGRDLLSTTNDLSQQAEFKSRNEYGQVTNGTDINSIGRSVFYDELGREYMRKDDTGSWARTETKFCTSGCPAGAVYFTLKRAAGGSSVTEYYDILGRAIRSSKVSFDGRIVNVDTEYDNVSRVKRQSLPFFDGGTPAGWTTNSYDYVGRLASVTAPDGSVTRNEIHGYSTVIYNPLNQTRTEIRNGLGQLAKVTDYDGGTITYDYDILGGVLNVTTKTKPAENLSVSVRMCYDEFGRKSAMLDPDKGGFKAAAGDATLACSAVTEGRAGWWTYKYDGFGELISQHDPKGQVVNIVYDKLGRMIGRTDLLANGSFEGFTQWFYEKGVDGSLASVQGKLTAIVMNTDPSLTMAQINSALDSGDSSHTSLASCTENSISCHKTINHFDIFARPLDTTVYYPGSSKAFISRVDYDLLGRPNRQFDALDFAIGNASSGVQTSYNDYGYAIRTSDIGSGELIQETLSVNANGQALQEYRGNGVTSTNVYDELTGQLTDQQSGIGNLFSVQNIHYKWDKVGNLKYRDNQSPFKSGGGGTKNLKESFCYDNLNRLTKTVPGVISTTPDCTGTQDIVYNGLGNITSKNGIGSYAYGVNAGPHAVTSAGANTYTYDNNGNQITGDGRTLAYTTYDQPTLITKNGISTTFSYGPDRARWKRVDVKAGVTTTTTYLGNIERITSTDTTDIEWKRYVGGVIYTYKTSATNQLQASDKSFVYNDHLGSLDVVTNAAGVIQQSLSFDPWGARRSGETWLAFSPTELSISSVFKQPITKRGFTGHEMVDDMGLIHMNGRIYDQKLARFLQADPFIQAASNTQSYNRYSYVLNNPLNKVDPSGFNFLSKVYGFGFKITGGEETHRFLNNNVPGLIPYIQTALNFIPAIGWIISAAFSANNAFYLSGGSLNAGVRPFATSVVSYYAFSAVGKAFNQTSGVWAQGGAAHIFAHAMVGGVLSVMQGGKFGNGFVSAGLTKGFMSHSGFDYSDVSSSAVIGRTVIAAIVGGTISEITGGKFANGAITAAMAHLYNAEQTAKSQHDALEEIYRNNPDKWSQVEINGKLEWVPKSVATDMGVYGQSSKVVDSNWNNKGSDSSCSMECAPLAVGLAVTGHGVENTKTPLIHSSSEGGDQGLKLLENIKEEIPYIYHHTSNGVFVLKIVDSASNLRPTFQACMDFCTHSNAERF